MLTKTALAVLSEGNSAREHWNSSEKHSPPPQPEHSRRTPQRNHEYPVEEHTTCSMAETFDQFWHRGRPEPRHSSFFYRIDPAPQKQAREMRRSAKTVHCEHKSTTCMSSRVRQRRFSSHVSAVVAIVSAVSSDPPDCHNVSHPGLC